MNMKELSTSIRLLLLALMMFLSVGLSAQTERTVTGRVTDEHGEPLIGAGVVPVSGKGGTVTDLDGRYSIAWGGQRMSSYSPSFLMSRRK